jgi:AsmA protein
MKRRVFRIVFFSTIGVVFLLTLMGLIFQDRIINAAMDNIRRNIRSRITIGDASFSLIKDFPYASVRLYNVSILSTKDIARRDFRQIVKPDTLLKARTLNIKLNVIDLINAKITLKQIDIRDGELNILIDKKGNNNYQILKKSKDDEKTQVLLKRAKVDSA